MAEANGLYYEEWGQAGRTPLILSSGLGGSTSYWAPNIDALAERFRVIAYDHRGTGRSDRTPLASLSIEDMADDVIGLMDHLGLPSAHFMGHALGGLIGMALALKAPERVERLVVINGWVRLEPHTARCFEARLALLDNSGPEAFLRAQPIFLYPANWLTLDADPALLDAAAQLAHFPGAETTRQRIEAVQRFNIEYRVAEIASPLLAVSAGDDILVPSIASSRIIDRITAGNGSTEYSMYWGGHACNVTDPDTFNAVVPGWIADGSFPIEEEQ